MNSKDMSTYTYRLSAFNDFVLFAGPTSGWNTCLEKSLFRCQIKQLIPWKPNTAVTALQLSLKPIHFKRPNPNQPWQLLMRYFKYHLVILKERVHPKMKISLIKKSVFVIVPIRFISFSLFYFLDGKVTVK